MKHTGVWIDQNKALIVTIENGVEKTDTITSNVEHYKPHGGSGTRFKGGPQDVIQDSKYLEREKHQLKRYFEDIIEKINNTDALVIFGPAETNNKFGEELSVNHKLLSTKIKGIRKTDSMTDNQVKAWVRDFYAYN